MGTVIAKEFVRDFLSGQIPYKAGELRIQRQVYWANGELVVSAPKTKATLCTIVLPSASVGVLQEYQQQIDFRWMFPSPAKENSLLDPATVRKRLQIILKQTGCKRVLFDDLCHTFATLPLQHGVDVKTLSNTLGHYSAGFTLDTYTHATQRMKREAADTIGSVIDQVMQNYKKQSWAKARVIG